jgi:predicted nucleic acid-binding protein
VSQFVQAIERRATLIPEVPRRFAYSRDPKDEPYINLALAAGAKYLVTRDHDLLDLCQPANPEGERLRQIAPDIRIVDPARFLLDFEKPY